MTRRRVPTKGIPFPALPAEVLPFMLLGPPAAAQFLGTTESTLADWRLDKKGPPYIKLTSGMIRYQLRDLQAHIAARCCGPIAEHRPVPPNPSPTNSLRTPLGTAPDPLEPVMSALTDCFRSLTKAVTVLNEVVRTRRSS
jgi:hypothetical protein